MSNHLNLFKTALSLPQIGITEAAEEARNELALRAIAVTAVTTPEQQQEAAAIARDIRTLVKSVEDAGTDYRKPLRQALSLIKAAEDQHLAPLDVEQRRLERLLVDFQAADARRVIEAEKARQDAYETAEAARLEADQIARDGAESATTAKGAALAVKLQAKADAAEAAVQAVINAPLPAASRVAGISVRKKLCYEVLDAKAVYAARPELCRIEVAASAVLAVCVPEFPVPGLRLWYENVASTRTR